MDAIDTLADFERYRKGSSGPNRTANVGTGQPGEHGNVRIRLPRPGRVIVSNQYPYPDQPPPYQPPPGQYQPNPYPPVEQYPPAEQYPGAPPPYPQQVPQQAPQQYPPAPPYQPGQYQPEPYAPNPYPQNAYPAAQYQPEQYPAEPYPPAAPPKKSRTGLWVLLVIVLLVLCCGGGIGAYVLTQNDDPGTVTPSTSTSTSAKPRKTTSVALPKKLIGRARTTDKTLKAAETTVINDETKGLNKKATVVAGYFGSAANKDLMLAVAVLVPGEGEANILKAVDEGMQQFKDLKPRVVAAGPLGGKAKCGDTTLEGTKIAICYWADNDSYGYLMFFGASSPKVESLLAKARGEIETVS